MFPIYIESANLQVKVKVKVTLNPVFKDDHKSEKGSIKRGDISVDVTS